MTTAVTTPQHDYQTISLPNNAESTTNMLWKPYSNNVSKSWFKCTQPIDSATIIEQKIVTTILEYEDPLSYLSKYKEEEKNSDEKKKKKDKKNKRKLSDSEPYLPSSSSLSSSSASSSSSVIIEKAIIPIGNGETIPTLRCILKKKSQTQLAKENQIPIVAVHGMGGGLAMWALSMECLAKNSLNGEAYFIDLPGFATSARRKKVKKNSSAKEVELFYVNAFNIWQNMIRVEKITLIGHSLGGFLSGCYALHYPNKIHHLILVDPWGMKQRTEEEKIRQEQSIPWWIQPLAKVADGHGPLFMLRCSGPMGKSVIRLRKNLGGDLNKFFDNGEVEDYFYYCNVQKPTGEMRFMSLQIPHAFAADPLEKRLHALEDINVDFIIGERTWLDASPVVSLSRKMQNASLTFVDAGHQVFLDNPPGFNEAVTSILRRN